MTDIIVYGSGKTGLSVCKMLEKLGMRSRFYDDDNGFETGGGFSDRSIVIVSPGVMPNASGMMDAKKVGARIIGELEFCLPYLNCRVVSVTGTNGKTTTCEMIHSILRGRYNSHLLGNGGVPLSSKILDTSIDDIVVLESSSFQLADCNDFTPFISVFTNLARDHINYHGTFGAYREAKLNNFIHQKKSSFAIFNADDESVVKLSSLSHATKLYYSVSNNNANCYYDGTNIILDVCGDRSVTYAKRLSTFAKHNLSNALAAVLSCKLLGIGAAYSSKVLNTYKFLPHRLQIVDIINGVTFVDDSKATNVHATLCALNNYDDSLALILGGSNKGESFDPIFANLKPNVKFVVATGETAEAIVNCGKKYLKEILIFEDIKQATKYCFDKMRALGDGTVLMSNACASFDKFSGYAERGEYFQKAVREIHFGEEKN